ncbi:MAG: hypothetical protein ACYDC9_07620 [Dermatophilaceae bacterium]
MSRPTSPLHVLKARLAPRVYTVVFRVEPAPDDAIVMLRAGGRGLVPEKLESDAVRSLRATGILGISVVAALVGETLEQAWERSPVTAGRLVVWWSTAGRLRESGFALLATGHNPRHFTVVLQRLERDLLVRLAAEFTKQVRSWRPCLPHPQESPWGV